MRRPVAEKRRREHNLSPEKLLQSAVQAFTVPYTSNALAHAYLLWRVGAGVLARHPGLRALALELLAIEFASFVHPQTLNAETAWNRHILYEYLESTESAVLGLQPINLRSLGVLVRNICDVLEAP